MKKIYLDLIELPQVKNTDIIVVAIIVLYNPDLNNIYKIRETLKNQVRYIIYVDNSSRNSLETIGLDSNEYVIPNMMNFGIAKAQNQGITIGAELGATHYLFLDQDSVPGDGMVEELLKPFNEELYVGCVGANIINAFNPSKIASGLIVRCLSVKSIPLESDFTEVTLVISSGSLVSAKVINDVGMMKEVFFIDGVDFEWCFRAKKKGYKIFQSKNAKLLHELGNGADNKVLSHSPFREYYIVRNSLRILTYSYIPFGYRIRRLILSLARTVSNCRPSYINYLKSDIKAIKDWILNNL